MSTVPSHEDANLIIKLYELRREDRMRQARDWFSKSFHAKSLEQMGELAPPGSEQNAYYRQVVSYWEMVASFVNSGVLNRELFYRSGMELVFVYERVRDVLPEMRKMYQNPFINQELEKAAEDMIEWIKGFAPDGYAAFAKMVRG